MYGCDDSPFNRKWVISKALKSATKTNEKSTTKKRMLHKYAATKIHKQQSQASIRLERVTETSFVRTQQIGKERHDSSVTVVVAHSNL